MLVSLPGRRCAALLRRSVAIACGATLALAAVTTGSAHAYKKVGPYTLAIGWNTEPVYAGFSYRVLVIVTDSAGKPVNDLKPGDLRVQVSFGGQSTEVMGLDPNFDRETGLGTPGMYDTPIIPTVAGAYTFHVTGNVHGTVVDQSVGASAQTIDSVAEPSDYQFPAKLPSVGALSTKADQAVTRAAAAQKAADDASSSASRAMTVGILALVAGVLLGGGGTALALRRRNA